MKSTKFWLGACAMLAFGSVFTSCSDNDEPDWNDDGSKIDMPDNRMFILNEGTQSMNNANISLVNLDNNSLTEDIFLKQNGSMLGDVAQDMIEYDDNIYVAVYGSNYLAKLNAAAVETARVSFASDPELQGGVRYIAAEDGYLYASFYGGVVAKINANSLQVEKKIAGLGNNIEGVAIEGNSLYVADSYLHTDSGYVYNEKMYVIDLKSFSLKETIAVSPNPNQVLEEDDKIFLISWGNYKERGYEFQMIDPRQNNKVTVIAEASKMAAGNDMVYLVMSKTDYSNWPETTTENTFSYYDIKAGKYVASSFINDPQDILKNVSIYMMAVDDESGDIFIGATNYGVSNGTIYRVKRDGTIAAQFDCGGQNPRNAVFLNKH